ncbi:MAG: bifunctional oligoribonuclease/PAP phosphatase NrnA [bacterium]|nr:bifunctional oligoribonuclease/PAP phosphatase NrnA [bacterium]
MDGSKDDQTRVTGGSGKVPGRRKEAMKVIRSGRRMWDGIIPIIRRGERFVVTGHEHADGDALGSQIALSGYLRRLGKRVRAVNSDEPQPRLGFLDPRGTVEVYRPGSGDGAFAGCDAWFVVDTCALSRIGAIGEMAGRIPCPVIVIDHHVFTPEEAFADINIVDERAVATAQMIYRLGRELGCRPDRATALALYTGIYTDSGGFVYTKMNAEAHRITADLMDAGVVPYKVFDRLFQTHTAAEAALFGQALNSLRFSQNGRVAWMTLTARQYAASGADPEGSENVLLNYVRSVRTVEVVVLLRQLPAGRVKVSLRAKNFFKVSPVARELGGGGHWFAAGALVEGSLARVQEKVKASIAREWRRQCRAARKGGGGPCER